VKGKDKKKDPCVKRWVRVMGILFLNHLNQEINPPYIGGTFEQAPTTDSV